MELERNKEKNTLEVTIQANVEKFKQLVLLAKNIDFDPEGTINKMTTVCPECSNIETLQEGLKGQFTRDQSVALAKTQLFNSLGTVVENLNKELDTISIDNFINNIMQEVNSYVETVISSIDVQELRKRKEVYLRNSVTVEYFKKQLDKILNEKSVQYKTNRPSDLLLCFREIIAMVVVNDLTYVDPIVEKTKTELDELQFYFSKIGTPEYRAVEVQATQQEYVIKPEEILNTYIQKAKIDNTNETSSMDIVSGIIERTDTTLESLEKTKQEIIQKFTQLPKVTPVIISTLSSLLSEVVLGYLKFNKITVEEFNVKLKDGYNVLDNLILISKDIRIVIYNIVINYLNNVMVFKEIYNIINEITTQGTFEAK